MKQKYLALALSAIFASAALTGCGSSNDDNYIPPPPDTGIPETPDLPGGETPAPTPDDGDNVGNAAEGSLNLNEDTTVGSQQYVRGAGANFDRTLNPNSANNGNETVLNSKTLQNLRLDNILVGRETVQRLDQDEAVLRLAGEAVNGFSDNRTGDTIGLQQHNTTGGAETRTTPDLLTDGTGDTVYYTAQGSTVGVSGQNLTYNSANTSTTPNGYPLYTSTGAVLTNDGTPTGNPLYLNTTSITTGTSGNPAATTGNNIQVDSDIFANDPQETGLVYAITDGSGGYAVVGQEDKAGQRANVVVDGSDKSTRIFGNKYRDVNNAAASNSYRFTEKLNAAGEYENINTTNFDDNFLQEIKLNNVQYGRVTSDIDQLGVISTIGRDGTIYYQSEILNAGDRLENGSPDQVDTYFYRGTNESTVGQMNAFFADQGNIDKGTVSYAGHAVMYGIDNTYHGNKGNPDTNAPGGVELGLASVGNLVQANVDINERKIAGSIFNVWAVAPANSDLSTLDPNTVVFRKDDLVEFNGDIFGNTAKGSSKLAYGNRGEGAFKGSFFGPNAEEFGGSVNSIDEGAYGKAAWGGVFGTQKVTQVIVDGNANQTE